MTEKITEQFVVNKVIEFMINKENGNWHEEKVKKSELHQHGVDIKLVGGKSKEDGKISGINHAYKYGLGLYWESAQVALRRISKEIAEVLCLHIFSVNDNGEVKYFTPSKFGRMYEKEDFFN